MNGEKIKDPTADTAIGKYIWEEKQRAREEVHGIKRGDKIVLRFKERAENSSMTKLSIRK